MQYFKFGFFIIAMLVVFGLNNSQIFAQTNDVNNNFIKISGNEIKNNPTAQEMLKKIEESYKILGQLKSGHVITKMTEAQKLVEEQRKIANEKLATDLASMNKEYSGFTSDDAFSKFVASVGITHQGFYTDQYNHFKNKIELANNAKKLIMDNGGTYREAQAEYIKYASLSRTEMVKIVSDLNIKHGFSTAERQSYFDEHGTLPRYDIEPTSICFNCQEYEPLVHQLIFASPTLTKSK